MRDTPLTKTLHAQSHFGTTGRAPPYSEGPPTEKLWIPDSSSS
jgi:hypothetical protein